VYVLSDSVNGGLSFRVAYNQRCVGSLIVRAQISRQRTLLVCVLLSQAAMHSGMSLPLAPIVGTALPPELSTGTGVRALGLAVAVASRVAVGSTMPAEVELGMVPEVADPGTISPGLEPAVVVEEPVVVVVDAVERMVAGCDVRPVLEFGSVGVARSCALGFGKGVGGWPVVVPGCVEPGVPDENTEVELWVKFGAELGAAGVLGAGEVLRA
jgi:hypothetical protein